MGMFSFTSCILLYRDDTVYEMFFNVMTHFADFKVFLSLLVLKNT